MGRSSGRGRGGSYSYDALEIFIGREIHTADRVEHAAPSPGRDVRDTLLAAEST